VLSLRVFAEFDKAISDFPRFDLVSIDFLQTLHHRTASKFICVKPIDHRPAASPSVAPHRRSEAMEENFVPASACAICSGSAETRAAHFSTPYIRIPKTGLCVRCFAEFWRCMGWHIGEAEIEEFERQHRKH
jgi:hypothetical protein